MTSNDTYQVVIHNNETTSALVVSQALQAVFGLGAEESMVTMLSIHTDGAAAVGEFTQADGQAKIEELAAFMANTGQELQATIEAADWTLTDEDRAKGQVIDVTPLLSLLGDSDLTALFAAEEGDQDGVASPRLDELFGGVAGLGVDITLSDLDELLGGLAGLGVDVTLRDLGACLLTYGTQVSKLTVATVIACSQDGISKELASQYGGAVRQVSKTFAGEFQQLATVYTLTHVLPRVAALKERLSGRK